MNKRSIDAVADVLSSPENSQLSAQDVALRAIEAYEASLATTHNLVVVGRFTFDGEETFEAAVGPLSTRAKAAAREVGERFIWDYKTKRGSGMYQFLPLLRSPKAAWDYVRSRGEPPATRREGPHLPLEPDVQAAITASMRWRPDDELPFGGPACTCPLAPCFRHPEGHP